MVLFFHFNICSSWAGTQKTKSLCRSSQGSWMAVILSHCHNKLKCKPEACVWKDQNPINPWISHVRVNKLFTPRLGTTAAYPVKKQLLHKREMRKYSVHFHFFSLFFRNMNNICAWHCSRCFTGVNSFNSHSNLRCKVDIIIIPILQRSNKQAQACHFNEAWNG